MTIVANWRPPYAGCVKRVLFLYGGFPGHRPYEVAKWARGLMDELGFEVEETQDPHRFEDDLTRYDLIVLGWTQSQTTEDLTDKAEQRLIEAARAGTGFAGWHGMTASFRASLPYSWIVGADFVEHPASAELLDVDRGHLDASHPRHARLAIERRARQHVDRRIDVHVVLLGFDLEVLDTPRHGVLAVHDLHVERDPDRLAPRVFDEIGTDDPRVRQAGPERSGHPMPAGEAGAGARRLDQTLLGLVGEVLRSLRLRPAEHDQVVDRQVVLEAVGVLDLLDREPEVIHEPAGPSRDLVGPVPRETAV